jgi:hypothetical protein
MRMYEIYDNNDHKEKSAVVVYSYNSIYIEIYILLLLAWSYDGS